MGNEPYHCRQLAHFVSQTSAAVAYDTRTLVVDSYSTIRRSMRRTADVVTRVRRDFAKREVDYHIFTIRLPLIDRKAELYIYIYWFLCVLFFAAHLLTKYFYFFLFWVSIDFI